MAISRRALIVAAGAAVAGIAGCIGPSPDDDDSNGDENDEENGGPEGPPGEIIVQGPLEGSVVVGDVVGRFEESTIDEDLIIEGTLTNEGDQRLRADMLLELEGFQFRDLEETVEVDPDDSTEFELVFTDVFADQFSGYTLTITAEAV